MKACIELRERMRPMREKRPSASWKALVEACFLTNVDLTARY